MTQRFPEVTQDEQSATARANAAAAVEHDARFPGVLALHAFTDNA